MPEDRKGMWPVAAKVPEITALFWVIKVLTTGTGEAASDYFASVSLVVAGGIGAVGFAISLWLQFRTPPLRPGGVLVRGADGGGLRDAVVFVRHGIQPEPPLHHPARTDSSSTASARLLQPE